MKQESASKPWSVWLLLVAVALLRWHGIRSRRHVRAASKDLSCLLSLRGRCRGGNSRCAIQTGRKLSASKNLGSIRRIRREIDVTFSVDSDLPVNG